MYPPFQHQVQDLLTTVLTEQQCMQCGLDYARAEAAGPEEQAEVFSLQLCLGQKLQRPVSVRKRPLTYHRQCLPAQ